MLDLIRNKGKTVGIDINFSCKDYTRTYENKNRNGLFFCRAGINIGSILIEGCISACPNIDRSYVQENIYRDDWSTVISTKVWH